jgi:hypothetical protein
MEDSQEMMRFPEDRVTFLMRPQPKVTLLHATPEWLVAVTTQGYTGKFSTSMTAEEVDEFWRELGNTKLKAPLEMANTVWLLEDVTRSFTHQLVRYRTASVVQESLRFSVQDANKAGVMVPASFLRDASTLEDYCNTAEESFRAYDRIIEAGHPVQDARAILPHNTCTRLYFGVDMRTLAHIAEQRYCCQAQGSGAGESGEWTSVMDQMKEQLLQAGFSYYAAQFKAPWESPSCVSCGFGASFDRPCSYQDKFDFNLAHQAIERGIVVLTER